MYNIPGYAQGSKVVYSYLQEVDHGKVVWDWKSIDYPELYGYTVTEGDPRSKDFANQKLRTMFILMPCGSMNPETWSARSVI